MAKHKTIILDKKIMSDFFPFTTLKIHYFDTEKNR